MESMMINKIILLAVLTIVNIQAEETMVSFYKSALRNLQYDKKDQLLVQSNTLEQKAVSISRFSNFSLDAGFTGTKAKGLPQSFNTTDISLNDTIDLFGKSTYKINELSLKLKEQKTLLHKQKEELFISLVEMISGYRQTKEALTLHIKLLDDQQSVLDNVKRLTTSGIVSNMDYLRLKNSTNLLKTQIVNEKNQLEAMYKQLMLYTKGHQVPSFDGRETLNCTKEAYLRTDTNTELNAIAAAQLTNEANRLSHSYIPELTVGTSYQNIDDPTANGNNYAFHVGINIPFDGGNVKQSEALKAQSLSASSNMIESKILREKEYIQRAQNITNASEQLQILKQSLDDSLKNQKVIQEAFLKRYVDFNTYIQVVSETLSIQEQVIKMRFLKNTEITILNTIASGVIYE